MPAAQWESFSTCWKWKIGQGEVTSGHIKRLTAVRAADRRYGQKGMLAQRTALEHGYI